MIEYPNTEDKNNWSVFLFDCPKERVAKLIVPLFKHAKEIVPNSLPNYTMRDWARDSVKISFRVLRDKDDRETVQKLEKAIQVLLEKETIKPIINPKGEHAKISGWSKDSLPKCKAYSRLSEFVVKLADENLFEPSIRNEMRHLAINMLFMREAAKYPEPFSFFVDLISNQIIRQPYPLHIHREYRL